MKNSYLYISFVHLFICLVCLLAGVFFISMHYVDGLQCYVSNFLISNPYILLKLGIVFSVCSFFLFFMMLSLYKKSYLMIKMNHSHQIKADLIKDYLNLSWGKICPDTFLFVDDCFIKKNKIHLITTNKQNEIPKKSLLEIEQILKQNLQEKFGYVDEFYLTISKD